MVILYSLTANETSSEPGSRNKVEITKSIQDQSATLGLVGRLDTITAPRLEEELKEILSNVTELAMTLPNDGFLGFPVALIFFGQEGLFLMIAHNVALNVITFSYGLHCLRRNDPNRPHPTAASVFRAAMRVILNPNLLAIYLGLAISLLHLPLANPKG